jgi:hypothetical protein
MKTSQAKTDLADAGNVEVDGDLPILIPAGGYDAEAIRLQRVNRFKRQRMQIRFRIVGLGPYQGAELDGWVPLNDSGALQRGSKGVRWYQALELPACGRRRVPLSALTKYLLRVRVRTVKHDSKQRPLQSSQWYSVVDEVLGQNGQLGWRESRG